MKKYACLLLFALLLNGCDDGDLTPEIFDFTDVSIQNCTDTYELLYKLKNQESLLLQMPEETLINEVGDQEFDINNSTFKLVYRTYNGTVATANICDAIRPSTPNVTNELYAISGKIKISTTATYTTNTTENSTRISGYSHIISFEDVTYSQSAGDQIGPSFVFGTFVTDADDLNLTFKEAVDQCTDSKQVYNYNTGNATSFTIDNIESSLIVNEATPAGQPRTGLISSTNNLVTYKIYEGLITDTYFCNTTTPSTPAVKETWKGLNGGVIEVTTTTLGTAFKHVIVFKNVELTNGNVSFSLGSSFLYGELITN
ncbi:hypothetical protein [Flavobacterium ajazii]|uniref:hypothetical protein n=1 Tax=Flavobacterium ajazii TaxID=2692318 RepID=UPI0013CF5C08|nr:hypothetical protein [Flavobacterium ajazii]